MNRCCGIFLLIILVGVAMRTLILPAILPDKFTLISIPSSFSENILVVNARDSSLFYGQIPLPVPTHRAPDNKVLFFCWIMGKKKGSYDVDALLKNRNTYAETHSNVEFRFVSEQSKDVIHPAWQKVFDIQANIDKGYSWFWALDSDALIRNFRVNVFDHFILPTIMRFPNPDDIHLIIAKDCNGINTGSFFVRSSEYMKEFTVKWTGIMRTYRGPWEEQGALMQLMRQNVLDINSHVAYVPQHLINAYVKGICGYREVEGTDLAYHAPGSGYQNLVKYLKDNESKFPSLFALKED